MTTDSAGSRKAAEIVAERWQEFMGFGGDVIDPAMVRAAYAQPRLRVLFPGVSHGILHLSRCTGYPASHDVPLVHPLAAGGFQVTGRAGEGVLGEVATLEAAFALVVAHLPEGSGPAVLGTKDDL
ncbi:DUF6193 family natural product biosynthesis protein [Streptomyces sp. NPDC006463]|uniref:DUF6193 family natural product biosynthesis protein n=1 Tax=Streptomyces sp. NPDC006463 TaxID=3364746 RepID=UPI0036B2E0D6